MDAKVSGPGLESLWEAEVLDDFFVRDDIMVKNLQGVNAVDGGVEVMDLRLCGSGQ